MNDIELPPVARDAFYKTVWKIVRLIPSGKVSTYGQIGEYIPCPEGVAPEDYPVYRARWVGYAMAACPPDVPWQRVINSQGKISTRPGAETQRRLLESEGIPFNARDRIDLKRFGWDGPQAEWLRKNDLLAPDEPRQQSLF